MVTLITLALLALLAPLAHGMEQVLTIKPGKGRWRWMSYNSPKWSALDAEHLVRGTLPYIYGAYGVAVAAALPAWAWWVYPVAYCGWLAFHYTLYNLAIHRFFVAAPDRPVWRCIVPGQFFYEWAGKGDKRRVNF